MMNSRTLARGDPFTGLRARPTYSNINSRFDIRSDGRIRMTN